MCIHSSEVGIGSGPQAQGRRTEMLKVSPTHPSPVHLSPSCLQILGQKSQGFWYHLHILHPCLGFLWPDLVPHLRTLTRGEGRLGMVTLQVILWPGFHVPCRSLLRGAGGGPTPLFKFLQQNSQDQHLLRPLWHPRLRIIILEQGEGAAIAQQSFYWLGEAQGLGYTKWHLKARVEGSAGWLNTFF